MAFWTSKEDRIYSGIAAALKDEGIADVFKQASGHNITDISPPSDPPLLKFKKSIEFLKKNDNERWLLIYVLANVAGPEAEKVLDAFPETLKDLPAVDGNVNSVIEFLKKMELYPPSPVLKNSLRLKRSGFAEIVRRVVTLFVYKSLHNSLVNLLFSINVTESFRVNPDTPPNFAAVADNIDEVVEKRRKDLGLLGAEAADTKARIGAHFDELAELSDQLRKAANPACASVVLTDIRLSVREILSQLNESVFAAANDLSFDRWLSELPGKIQDSDEFKEFDQVIRDLTATLRARAFKHKLWLEAETKLSSMGQSFGAPTAGELWITLSQNVEWLAALESDAWAEDARKFGADVAQQISRAEQLTDGEQLTDVIKRPFDAYQRWFSEPFSRIDSGLTDDCGSLYRMDVPFSTIWKDLGI